MENPLRSGMPNQPDFLTIRCGARLTYEALDPTHIVLLIQPRMDDGMRMESEQLQFWTKVVNIGLVPLLVALAGLALAFAKRRRIAAAARPA